MAVSGCRALIQKCTGGLVGGNSETPQFLILGLDGVGKTTLLYRLKLGERQWRYTEMEKDMLKMRTPHEEKDSMGHVVRSGVIDDPGYHYEELSVGLNCGLWEVPGTESMRHVWSCFYHAIKIHGVIFVVDGRDALDPGDKPGQESFMRKEERIQLAKRHLHFLMNEEELRFAAFAIIINEFDDAKGLKINDKSGDDEWTYRLGMHKLHPQCSRRYKKFRFNCLKANSSDRKWQDVQEFMKTILQSEDGHALPNLR